MADHADKFQSDAEMARLIIESATDFAIISSDPQGILTSWNPGAEKLLGWTADEAIGQHVELFFTSDDRQSGRPQTEMALARAGRNVRTIEEARAFPAAPQGQKLIRHLVWVLPLGSVAAGQS